MRSKDFRKKDELMLGEGQHKEVYKHPERDDRVVTVYKLLDRLLRRKYEKMKPEQVKAIYYFTKIAHYVLPDVIPDVYQAFLGKDGVAVVDAERMRHSEAQNMVRKIMVDIDKGSSKDRDLLRDYADSSSKASHEIFTDTINISSKLANSGFGGTDIFVMNYGFDNEGNAHYLELLEPRWVSDERDSAEYKVEVDERVSQAIDRIEDLKVKRVARKYLERLLELRYRIRAKI